MNRPDERHRLRADAARNRERVLEAAEEVFAEQGPTASTEEIARRAGVGIGTVFRHFPTKEALLETVFVAQLTRLCEQAHATATTEGAQQALFGLFARAVELSATKRAVVEAISSAGVDTSPLTSLTTNTLVPTLDRLLAGAQQAGTVRDDLRVNDLIALLVGTARAAEHANEDPVAHEHILAVVLSGLSPATTRGVVDQR